MYRLSIALSVLCLSLLPAHLARADDLGPPAPVATSPPVVAQPTAPAAEVPVVPAQPEPTQPPAVSREPASAAPSAPQQAIPQPTPAGPSISTQDQPLPGPSTHVQTQPSNPLPNVPAQPLTGAHAPVSGRAGYSPGAGMPGATQPVPGSLPTGIPPSLPSDQAYSSGATIPDVNTPSVSAAAPSQLTCHGKPRPGADPFMVSPFNGWTSINSFLDHDSPNYALDGLIVMANGLTASSSAGQASDFFPSYWSSALRQYISYDGHNGYDFGLSYQPILAAGDGTVTFADWNGASSSQGYGQMVLINHHNGYVTLYGHLSRLEVHAGEGVSAGQEIGISGSTGNSSGPHLHFSVFHNCQVTDPYGWTGDGADPLTSFDGEKAGYLWLPGHDPLVLNPPPHWPTFPLGLHISLPKLRTTLRHVGHRVVPPIDRLILLGLPSPHAGDGVSAPAALALTEARISQESQVLAPYLEDLRRQGLVDGYQVIPAAAAVWVRGRATSNQLEGLPGVASLSGVQPKDLIAAQAGLSHSVLIQLSSGQAPSLWPAGFRSSLHAWRPVTTVANGHALVTGFTLPGQKVTITLHRKASVPAVAEAAADPQTGGFVAMLHDTRGNPVATLPNDVVQTGSGGRMSSVSVQGCSLRVRVYRITGSAPANASVALSLMSDEGRVQWHAVIPANARGRFDVVPPVRLAGGTQAIASFVNAAGDDEAVTGVVPGIVVSQNSATIRGWTVGNAPQLTIQRGHISLFHTRLQPSPDGTFQVEASRSSKPVAIRPGDAIIVGSAWHHRRLVVPHLRIQIQGGTGQVEIVGPAFARLSLREYGHAARTWNGAVTLSRWGRARVAWHAGAPGQGDAVRASYVFPSGDLVEATAQAQGIVLREGRAEVTGQGRPGATISFRLSDPSGAVIASAVVTTQLDTGSFQTTLVDGIGKHVPVRAGERLLIRQAGLVRDVAIPALSLHLTLKHTAGQGVAQAPRDATLVMYDPSGRTIRALPVLRSLTFSVSRTRDARIRPHWLVLRARAAVGVTIQRGAGVAFPSAHTRPRGLKH
ncbi:MAG: hypothetical protein NVS4B2_00790 [Chloroflexota bacterium]